MSPARRGAAGVGAGLAVGTGAGVAVGLLARARDRRAAAEREATLDHALRGPLTIILGETELVLADPDAGPQARSRSAEAVVAMVRDIEERLRAWRSAVSP